MKSWEYENSLHEQRTSDTRITTLMCEKGPCANAKRARKRDRIVAYLHVFINVFGNEGWAD